MSAFFAMWFRSGPPPSPWFFVAWFGFIILVMAIAYFGQKIRKQRLIEAGGALGFFPEDKDSVPLRETDLFARGGQIELAMAGTSSGLECHYLDYSYGQGKSRKRQSVAVYRGSNVNLPTFRILPVSFATRFLQPFMRGGKIEALTQRLGGKYFVYGRDANAVEKAFTPGVLAYLEQLPQSDYWIEGAGDVLVLYKPSQMVSGSGLSTFLDSTGMVASGFFDQVRRSTF